MAQESPKKQLGQHWLHDIRVLDGIVNDAGVQPGDIVLEVGPGLGTLTARLLKKGAIVIAVEFDQDLAPKLKTNLIKQLGENICQNLTVVEQDILKFNFAGLPKNYKLVANIPYYLTSHLLRILTENNNPPKKAAILVQKEVAERVCAKPGSMSLLSVAVQAYFDTSLGEVVNAELFTPPPKVDSQVLILNLKNDPIVTKEQQQKFFKVVKAGFSERRKKLRSSLSGGLHISKDEADSLLINASIDPNLRAQNLTLKEWIELSKTI